MTRLPSYLVEVLAELASNERRVAYARTDAKGRVLERGGELGWYGLDELEPGDDLCRACVFLEGLIPMTSQRLDLPRLGLCGGRYADVHLVRTGEEVLVLLLDASGFVEQQSLLVQKGNDLNLLLGRMGKREAKPEEWPDSLVPAGEAVEREASVLSVHVVPVPSERYGDPSLPAELARLTGRMLLRLHERSAVTELCGVGRIQAVFGVLPSTGVARHQVLTAAQALRRLVSGQEPLLPSGAAPWSLCGGVATGKVVLQRDPETEARRVFMGEALDRAWTLCSSATGGQVLVDAATATAHDSDTASFRVASGSAAEAVYELERV